MINESKLDQERSKPDEVGCCDLLAEKNKLKLKRSLSMQNCNPRAIGLRAVSADELKNKRMKESKTMMNMPSMEVSETEHKEPTKKKGFLKRAMSYFLS